VRQQLRELFLATLPELAADRALRRHVRRDGDTLSAGGHSFDLRAVRCVHLLAFGKAARPMAQALLPLLHGCVVRGLCVPPAPDDAPLPPLEVIAGSHPLPDGGSLHAAERALVLLGNAGPDDLAIFLVSGGGSALLERPVDAALSLADLAAVHRLLVGSGADIVAMNTVRKHLSGVKGGRLAVRAQYCRQLTLFISDVPPEWPDMVASGPTWPDASTAAEAVAVLERTALLPQLPAAVRSFVARGLPETPKPGHPAFARSHHVSVLDGDAAVTLLLERAVAAGCVCERAPGSGDVPVDAAADGLLRRLHLLAAAHPGQRVAVLAGGELSVPLPAQHGIGGRNQQFALACALAIEGQPIAVLSAGTDGIDGNSPAAGAVVDGTTVARARALGLDPAAALANFDAYPLFAALGDAVVTGPTGTNVRDLRLLVAM
jgi:hydroxypyruvate reductase